MKKEKADNPNGVEEEDKSMDMTTSPKGIQKVNPVELGLHEMQARRDKRNSTDREDTLDTVVNISDRSSTLRQWLPEPEVDQEQLEEEMNSVDTRSTAEAIMKRIVPDLYQALVDAGEIEE